VESILPLRSGTRIPADFRWYSHCSAISEILAGIRLNKYENVDWILLKNTPVTEKLTAQFRAEFYNVFNLVSFARFTNDLSQPAFGTYSGTDTTPRQIQFGLKLLW
jgi:hypothetical protein